MSSALFLRLSRGHDVLFLIFCGENHTVVWVVCILCFVFFHTDLLNQYEQTKKTLCLKSSERANGKTYFFLFRRCKGDRSFLRAKNLAPSFALRRTKPDSSYSAVKRSLFCARKNLAPSFTLRRAKPDSSYSAVKRSLFCARKILSRLLHCDGQSLILPRFFLLFPLAPPIN